MCRGTMRVRLHHSQRLPAAEGLRRSEIYSRHNEPRGKSVPIAVPGVAVQMTRVLSGVYKGLAGSLNRLREELVSRSVGAAEHSFLRIVRELSSFRLVASAMAHARKTAKPTADRHAAR